MIQKTAKLMVIAAMMTMMNSCSSTTEEVQNTQTGEIDNILLKEWEGPYGGTPAFDKMDVADLKPAVLKAMELKLAEIDQITANTEEPNFENTILAYDKSGAEMDRVFTYFGIWSSNMSTPEFREIQAELTPILSEYRTKIMQNKQLFEKIKAVYEKSQEVPLGAQEQRTVELIYKNFAMGGAELDEDKKAKYAEISTKLSTLYNQFGNNVLADEEGYITYLTEDQLDGLPASFVKSASQIAEENGEKGKYAITNTRSSMDPFLTYSTNRELRKKVWTNYYSRGDNGDENDNNAIVAEILQLRKAKTALLGYDNYAAWRLQDRMAKTPENAMDLMMKVWPAAIARVQEEVADMQQVADDNKDGITIEPWDYRFYAEKVRKKKYDLNSDEVKQYLQLDKLKEAIFYTAGELFNYHFTPLEEGKVAVFHEDVKVWGSDR